jgi:signal transduction histidine kinase
MRRKIIFLVVVSMLIILTSLGVISTLSVNDSIERSLDSHLTLAKILSRNIDYILEKNLTRLHDISLSGQIDLNDEDWEPEKKALKTAYEYSIFTDSIFLLDEQGNVILTYPHKESAMVNLLGIPYVGRALSGQKPVVSDVYTMEPTKKKVILALVPLKDREGNLIGVVGGEIDPANYMFSRIIKSTAAGTDTIEIIDSHGVVISSNDARRILTHTDHNRFLGNLINEKRSTVSTCHRCHQAEGSSKPMTKDMLAFAPLSVAPWGVSVREPQDLALAPSTNLKKVFFVLSLIYIVTAVMLSIGLSRSIVSPIKSLIRATHRLGRGDLSEPVEVSSRDEIGALARSFDTMRARLAEFNNRLQKYNVELEQRVLDRTRELVRGKKQLALLLDEVIRAQEDERKRIARELHDETSQSIAAIGMSIEIASIALEEKKLTPGMLQELRHRVSQLLDDMNMLIQDLRPPVLDDLGLKSAIRWLLERHLAEKGIKYRLSASPEFETLGMGDGLIKEQAELTLFRVIQEAVINISKHADASNVEVSLSLKDSHMFMEVIDDGVGFDVRKVMDEGSEDGGYGLLGINERVGLLEGTLNIHSRPGEGTRITLNIPLSSLQTHDV